MIKLEHLVSGQTIYIREATDVRAVFHAPVEKKGTNACWIVISDTPPIPVANKIEEVLELTGFVEPTIEKF